ncbi:hypothetical protein GCM10014719_34730 [Planomonospora parontospora subsp. antibiotica]|uniref:hypothetical protein n=1 Tax=Planomonospora parontospora TaxID=58119 RepID=UPI0016708C32|nr:hypothetical protein [Planomonospora parontospora]GGL30434.1 hypothetical protein GCM10014719_34730 [Planomonospora parontospora subsp. antibiotica]GII17707.1 hypothetical protein Ppa05_44330 [Planomonospora parontospora subsp. antibiotica]
MFTNRRPSSCAACPHRRLRPGLGPLCPAAVKSLLTDRHSLTTCLRFPIEHHERVRHSDFIERTVAGEQSGHAVQEEPDALVRSPGVDLGRTTDPCDSLVRAALTPAWSSATSPVSVGSPHDSRHPKVFGFDIAPGRWIPIVITAEPIRNACS